MDSAQIVVDDCYHTDLEGSYECCLVPGADPGTFETVVFGEVATGVDAAAAAGVSGYVVVAVADSVCSRKRGIVEPTPEHELAKSLLQGQQR